MCSLRAGGNDEHTRHFMRCFVERDAVFEGVHDSFGCVQPDHLVQGGVLEAQVHERHTARSEEHTSELQSRENLVCRLLLEKKKKKKKKIKNLKKNQNNT